MEGKSKIVKRTVVISNTIENIDKEDFDNSINLKYKEPISICFYDETDDSQYMLRMFVNAADNVDGIKFGTVNMDVEKDILQKFKDLDDEDNPYNWAKFTHLPFILSYRLGFPQAFYNGSMDMKSLEYYFENLSHIKGYKEQKVVPISMKIDRFKYLRTSYE